MGYILNHYDSIMYDAEKARGDELEKHKPESFSCYERERSGLHYSRIVDG